MGISGARSFLHFRSSLYNLDYLHFASERPGPAGSGRQYLVYRSISGQGEEYVGKVKEPLSRKGRLAIFPVLEAQDPITVYQVFFCLVSPPDGLGILAAG